MGKFERLDQLLSENKGYLRTSDAVAAGVSKSTLAAYVRENGLERTAHGLYMSKEAWPDALYVLQVRYPKAVFSHETALYLLGAAEREPLRFSVTLEAGTNVAGLTKQGVRVHTIKKDLFEMGLSEAASPVGHTLRSYDMERTICDLVRSRRCIEAQTLQGAVKGYARSKTKNTPRLWRCYSNNPNGKTVESLSSQYVQKRQQQGYDHHTQLCHGTVSGTACRFPIPG